MATTLKELIDMATELYEKYGDIPLDNCIFLNEMPAECHRAFVGMTDVKSIIEVGAEPVPFRV